MFGSRLDQYVVEEVGCEEWLKHGPSSAASSAATDEKRRTRAATALFEMMMMTCFARAACTSCSARSNLESEFLQRLPCHGEPQACHIVGLERGRAA